ncbi:MAG TPA: ATP-binding protein [Natronosporangium sp.]
MSVPIDEIRDLFLFEKLAEWQLEWIAQRAEVRAFPAGVHVYQQGDRPDALWILLDGHLRLTRLAAGEEVTIADTSQRGVYCGATRAFAARPADSHDTKLTTVEPSRFLRIKSEDFATMMREWFPMAVHLLDGLYVGIRTTEATIRQREHLAQLGHLAANLAHELNNPAAATVRATAQLRTRVAGMRQKLGMIARKEIDRALLARLVALQEAAVERAAKQREPLSPLAESDLTDAFADRLDELDIPGSYDLAPVFVAAGLDVAWLDEVAAEVGQPDALEGALRWLAYTLETEALMDEIEDASTRISTMVAAVKQYSHLDQAAHQEVDLHPGLDSTLVMLGRKLAGIKVERDYDRSLPPVPAYASELNQVWTNLIDNAIAAMSGQGTLRLRTARDGDHAVVEVSDDGPGIPEAIRDRLFEPFVTTRPPGEGSGLGLDNVRRIVVKRHGGTVSFTTGSTGTTFTVRLPLTSKVTE